MKSTLQELSNDGLHDAANELRQKLLTINSFPGTDSIGNISETVNARKWKKYFSQPTFKNESIDVSIKH